MIYNIIGIIITSILFSLILLILMSLLYVMLKIRKHKTLLKISVSVLDFFHLQLKMLLKKLIPKMNFDQIMIDARNELNKESFVNAKRKIFLAPHCVRAIKCPAISTQYGVQCKLCGECLFTRINKEAERLNYSVFILAGSSFIKKLVEETDPEGILLLGCSYEINKVMMALNGRITYGISLLKDGCVNTEADVDKLISIMNR